MAVLGLVLVLSALYTPAAIAQDATPSNSLTVEEQKILAALNARRAEAGLGTLATDPLLNRAAQAHADDILHNRNYSHWGTDGTLAKDRVVRTGYSDQPWVSENWVSSSSPKGAMTWWMNDYVHRVNILRPRWREVGIGGAISEDSGEMVFVTVFSAGRSAGRAGATAAVSASAAEPSDAQVVEQPADPSQHVVRKGDTLLAIALRYGHDVAEIATLNGLQRNDLLRIGQVLHMPGYGEDASSSPIGGIGGPASEPTQAYVVAAGDTLFSIAAANGMTWQELARMNGLGEASLLQIGQTIQLPMNEATSDATDATAQEDGEQELGGETPNEAPLAQADSVDEPGIAVAAEAPVAQDTETASSGDASIAQGDDVEGQDESGATGASGELEVESVSAEDASAQYHVIGEGDTVIFIAQRYGIAWGDVLALNNLDDDSILEPGKILRLR